MCDGVLDLYVHLHTESKASLSEVVHIEADLLNPVSVLTSNGTTMLLGNLAKIQNEPYVWNKTPIVVHPVEVSKKEWSIVNQDGETETYSSLVIKFCEIFKYMYFVFTRLKSVICNEYTYFIEIKAAPSAFVFIKNQFNITYTTLKPEDVCVFYESKLQSRTSVSALPVIIDTGGGSIFVTTPRTCGDYRLGMFLAATQNKKPPILMTGTEVSVFAELIRTLINYNLVDSDTKFGEILKTLVPPKAKFVQSKSASMYKFICTFYKPPDSAGVMEQQTYDNFVKTGSENNFAMLKATLVVMGQNQQKTQDLIESYVYFANAPHGTSFTGTGLLQLETHLDDEFAMLVDVSGRISVKPVGITSSAPFICTEQIWGQSYYAYKFETRDAFTDACTVFFKYIVAWSMNDFIIMLRENYEPYQAFIQDYAKELNSLELANFIGDKVWSPIANKLTSIDTPFVLIVKTDQYSPDVTSEKFSILSPEENRPWAITIRGLLKSLYPLRAVDGLKDFSPTLENLKQTVSRIINGD